MDREAFFRVVNRIQRLMRKDSNITLEVKYSDGGDFISTYGQVKVYRFNDWSVGFNTDEDERRVNKRIRLLEKFVELDKK